MGKPSPARQLGASALTGVCLLGVLFALAPDDEHEDQKQDEDETHKGNNYQEPPLLVEGAGLLGWTQMQASGLGRTSTPASNPLLWLGPTPHSCSLW